MERDFCAPTILPIDTSHKDFPTATVRPEAPGEGDLGGGGRRALPAPADSAAAAGLDVSPSAASPTLTGGNLWTSSSATAPAFTALLCAAVHGGPDSLGFWAAHYLKEKVLGGSPNTLDAKSRDLRAFGEWFARAAGTCALRAWRPRDTRSYLGYLEGRNLAPSSINRAFATLRHFARWAHDTHGAFGTQGLPTADVRELVVEEAPCKKLDRAAVRAVFTAAEDRIHLLDKKRLDAAGTGRADPTRRQRPRRDLAMLTLLYYTGLRATELVMLKRAQYDGTHLHNVARKGQNRTRRLYVPADARRGLDDYLATERCRDDPQGLAVPLFLATRSGGYMRREYLGQALRRIGEDASKHRDGAVPIQLHPHRLRHTFGARHREKSGSDGETAMALGHKSLKYVSRYARKTDDEREALLEDALDV